MKIQFSKNATRHMIPDMYHTRIVTKIDGESINIESMPSTEWKMKEWRKREKEKENIFAPDINEW